jgi:hypothetical protein
MSYAYTPGLEITYFKKVKKERTLPLPGDVLVKKGGSVKHDTVIAKTMLPGDPYPVNVAVRLGVSPKDLEFYIRKKVGDEVEKDEMIAEKKTFFGLFKSNCVSPVSGEVEYISTLTGHVSIREPPKVLEVPAYIPGKISEVLSKKGAIVETPAAFVQGIFGVGGEKCGELVVVGPPDQPLAKDAVTPAHSGKVLVGGSTVNYETVVKAMEVGAVGIIVGGISREDLTKILGYPIGVAVTGHETITTTVIITEGFGTMTIAKRTFELLKSFEGYNASINGATQIRAGVIRPEVIIPLTRRKPRKRGAAELDMTEGIQSGTRVRVIRDPWFGAIGTVAAIPKGYHQIETESDVRVLRVELEDGKRVVIPRANVEIIGE